MKRNRNIVLQKESEIAMDEVRKQPSSLNENGKKNKSYSQNTK